MIEKAVRFVKEARVMVVGTGAGMGIDSGLPDFRGSQGFWNNYPPYRGKFSFTECANPDFLTYNPHLFWGFYGSRLAMYRQKTPHQGYKILREMASIIGGQKVKDNYFAVTSNVDGHFQKSGHTHEKVLQVHGSINRLQCSVCNKLQTNTFEPQVDYQQMSCKNLPRCVSCGGLTRPNILMFNDWQWMSERTDLQHQQYESFLQKHRSQKIVIIQIGAGNSVPTIRNMMEHIFHKNQQSTFIRLNPDTGISSGRWMDKERYVDVDLSALEGITKIRQML